MEDSGHRLQSEPTSEWARVPRRVPWPQPSFLWPLQDRRAARRSSKMVRCFRPLTGRPAAASHREAGRAAPSSWAAGPPLPEASPEREHTGGPAGQRGPPTEHPSPVEASRPSLVRPGPRSRMATRCAPHSNPPSRIPIRVCGITHSLQDRELHGEGRGGPVPGAPCVLQHC